MLLALSFYGRNAYGVSRVIMFAYGLFRIERLHLVDAVSVAPTETAHGGVSQAVESLHAVLHHGCSSALMSRTYGQGLSCCGHILQKVAFCSVPPLMDYRVLIIRSVRG